MRCSRSPACTRIHRSCAHLVASFVALAVATFAGSSKLAFAQGAHQDGEHDMMEWGTTAFALSEVLEYAALGSEGAVRYDLVAWWGGAENRVWAKADGAQRTNEPTGNTVLQLGYGRLISAYWDAQAGVALDFGYGELGSSVRPSLALGLQGLAPGWFEVEPTLLVSASGDVSVNLTAAYDLLLTQRLVLQPRIESLVAVQQVPERGVGSGLNDLELAVRLRYEVLRELAPYVGIVWERRFGETASWARTAGLDPSELLIVAGLRLWL